MSNLVFTVDSALLRELGEKLVETVHIALVELVKNSYDADATEVEIKIRPNSNNGVEIQIIDNGLGMTLDDVRNYWMRIATTNKVTNQYSELYGRPKTGSKGIGRFSCRRLGNYLKLVTIAEEKKGQFEKTEVEFPWDEFKPGLEVSTIICPGKTNIIADKNTKTGTTLIINGSFVEEWSEGGYRYLKRHLAVLVANRGAKREGFKEDPGFNIFLDCPRFEREGVKDLRDEVISGGWAIIEASIDKNGHAVCTLDAVGIGKKEITSITKFRNLTGAKLKIGLMILDKEQLRNPSLLSKGNLRTILSEWGGVQVRYNRFRVYPYGEDDWLEIDKDRGLRQAKPIDELAEFASRLKGVNPSRVLLSLLSMRNYIGTVEIDSRASGFEMKASREGFLHTKSVEELREFVRYAIDWATIYRDYFMRTKLKQDSEVAREYLEKVLDKKIEPEQVVENAIDYIQDEVKKLSDLLPSSEKKKVEESFLTATKAILKHDRSNKQELHHLRLIASTSTLLLIFSHEVKHLLARLEANIGSLASVAKNISGKEAERIEKIGASLNESKTRFKDLIEMTSLIGVDSKSAKSEQISLLERIKTAAKCFQLIVRDYGISINFSKVPDNIMVGPILEAELYSIILNALSNSIKSVIAAGGEKEIEFEAKREHNKTKINIRDTGLGIAKPYRNDVFMPFVADPGGNLYKNLEKRLNQADQYIVGTGSGLGLSIAKEIVQNRKGDIYFQEPSGKWKSDLEVILP
ncbi:MAG: sensor histidine kinase [Candidatus Omnitrophota bacterium]